MILPGILALYQRYKEVKKDGSLSMTVFGYSSTADVIDHSTHLPSQDLFPGHLNWHNYMKKEIPSYNLGSRVYNLLHPLKSRDLESRT